MTPSELNEELQRCNTRLRIELFYRQVEVERLLQDLERLQRIAAGWEQIAIAASAKAEALERHLS